MSIDFENDRMQSVEQIDSAKKLSDKIIRIKRFRRRNCKCRRVCKKIKRKSITFISNRNSCNDG
jgi:IS1 family transposase